MSRYTPDRWVLLDMITPGGTVRKVFAGWYGGYVGSDAWKLSSGLTKVDEHDDRYEFHNESGSIYTCYKGCHGMSGYMTQVFARWKDQETDDIKIVVVEQEPNHA